MFSLTQVPRVHQEHQVPAVDVVARVQQVQQEELGHQEGRVHEELQGRAQV